MIKQYGLLQDKPKVTDDRFGAISRSNNDKILNESGDWTKYLPKVEYQKIGFETMACVTFSGLNCIEALIKNKYGIEVNYSDRFTATMSGTTHSGNTFGNVADSIYNDGVVYEEIYPYVYGWGEYYEKVAEIVIKQAQSFSDKYVINYEFVAQKDIKEALKYAPLQVGVYAWTKPKDGIYPDWKGRRRNHGVMLYNYKEGEYWEIYDHYDDVKKKLAWDYDFGGILKYSIKLKEKPMLKLPNNTFIFQNPGKGKFGLYLDGKIYEDKLAEIMASWMMRNNGKTEGAVANVSEKDWDSVPKYNLENEKI